MLNLTLISMGSLFMQILIVLEKNIFYFWGSRMFAVNNREQKVYLSGFANFEDSLSPYKANKICLNWKTEVAFTLNQKNWF